MRKRSYYLEKRDALALVFFAILLAGKWFSGKDMLSIGDETNFIWMVEDGLHTLHKSTSFLECIKNTYFFSINYPPLYLWIASFFHNIFDTTLAGTRLLNVILMFFTTTCIYAIIKLSTQNRLLPFFGCAILFASPEWFRTLAIMDTCIVTAVFVLFYQLLYLYTLEQRTQWHYIFAGCTLSIGFLIKFNFIIYAFPLTASFIFFEIIKRKLDLHSSAMMIFFISLPSLLFSFPWYASTFFLDDNFFTKYVTGIYFVNHPDSVLVFLDQIFVYFYNHFSLYTIFVFFLIFITFAIFKKDISLLSWFVLTASTAAFLFSSLFLFYAGRYWIPRWNLSAHFLVIILCILISSLKIRDRVKNISLLFIMIPLLAMYSVYFGVVIHPDLMTRTRENELIGNIKRASPNTKLVFAAIDKHFDENNLKNARVLYFFHPQWLVGYNRSPNPGEDISEWTLFNTFPQLLDAALQEQGNFYFVVGKEWREHPEALRWYPFFRLWDSEVWSYFEKLPDVPTKPGLGQEIYYTNTSRFPRSALYKLALLAQQVDTDYAPFQNLTEARFALENNVISPSVVKDVLLNGVRQWQSSDLRWRYRSDSVGYQDAIQSLGQVYIDKAHPKPLLPAGEKIFQVLGEKREPHVIGESIDVDTHLNLLIMTPQQKLDFVRISFISPGGHSSIVYMDGPERTEIGAYNPKDGAKSVIFPLPHTSHLESFHFVIGSGPGKYRINSIEFF